MPPETLSAREREVLALASEGLTSGEIAARLGVARSTVETHVRASMRKLGARTRAHAVLLSHAVIASGRELPATPITALHSRDARLIELVSQGATVSEAAKVLGLSRRSASRSLTRLRGRLGARSTAELAIRAGVNLLARIVDDDASSRP